MKTLRSVLSKMRSIGRIPKQREERLYARWLDLYSELKQDEQEQLTKLQAIIPGPKICVMIDAKGAVPDDIEISLNSVEEQIYKNWEVFVDETIASDSNSVSVIAHNGNQALPLLQNAIEKTTSDVFVLIKAGDRISSEALFAVAWVFAHSPTTIALYSDQDVIDHNGQRTDPWCKGDWSPDHALGQAYTLYLGALRREALSSMNKRSSSESLTASFYAAWALLATLDEANVLHLPMILYHSKQSGGNEPEEFTTVASSVIGAKGKHLKMERIPQYGWRRVLWPIAEPLPRITLCIPTRDRVDLLSNCVEGLLHRTDWPNLEVIIVDNGSVEPETLAYMRDIIDDKRVKVIRYDGEFNFSRLNNIGASHASGLLFGLINNDLLVKDSNWLRIMASHAVRPNVGAVGALLYYGDDTIQHAGVVLGIGGVASHIHKRLPMGKPGYYGRTVVTQDVSSVTGACLLTRLDLYLDIGGLDEASFPVAYNDIDFCLKVRSRGLRVILAPDAQLYHLESLSRGLDNDPAKRARLARDKALMNERWGSILMTDPFYNPNLSLTATDCRLAWPPRARRPWADALLTSEARRSKIEFLSPKID